VPGGATQTYDIGARPMPCSRRAHATPMALSSMLRH